ncbi:MAG: hypothetical protein NBV67_00445 [Tagaea sp.]|nr:hypothetical protein [Tagaea sp.]
MEGSIFDVIASVSTALRILTAMLALWLLGWVLRRYDLRLGIVWKESVWPTLSADARALALYFGLRFVGCCLLIGAVLK